MVTNIIISPAKTVIGKFTLWRSERQCSKMNLRCVHILPTDWLHQGIWHRHLYIIPLPRRKQIIHHHLLLVSLHLIMSLRR